MQQYQFHTKHKHYLVPWLMCEENTRITASHIMSYTEKNEMPMTLKITERRTEWTEWTVNWDTASIRQKPTALFHLITHTHVYMYMYTHTVIYACTCTYCAETIQWNQIFYHHRKSCNRTTPESMGNLFNSFMFPDVYFLGFSGIFN